MTLLAKLRAAGAQYAIPLQVFAMLAALFQIFVWIPWVFWVNYTLDQHAQLLGLGGLSWFPWLLAWGTVFSDLVLWFLLRVMDADLNDGRG